MKPIIAWINCYGTWNPDERRPVEIIGYDQYLTGVVNSLALYKDRLEVVYVSGGQHDEWGKGECETTIPELKKRLAEHGIAVPIHADEENITSIGIVRTCLQTVHAKYPDHQPLLFCDMVRFEINLYLVEYFSKKLGYTALPAREILVPIQRLDLHPHSTPEKQQEKIAMMKEKGVEAVEAEQIEKLRELHAKLKAQ